MIETLSDAYKTQPDRKCFRLVGGVLVERTVKDVLPQLETQYGQLSKVLETLTGQYKTKEADFAEWQRKNNGARFFCFSSSVPFGFVALLTCYPSAVVVKQR